MHLQYRLDERPPLWKSMLLGLQWTAIVVPGVITLERALASTLPTNAPNDAGYLPKLFLVTAVTLVGQALGGHRLPVIAGPAAVLLVGVLASGNASREAVYGSIMIGGLMLLILAACGLLRYLRRLFTDNIVAVVLLLIAWTLMPTVSKLLLDNANSGTAVINLSFAAVLLAAMFVAQRLFSGIWRATVIVWAMLVGSPAYQLLVSGRIANFTDGGTGGWPALWSGWTWDPQLDPGVLISFLICYLALGINDLSSIESVNRMLHVPDNDRRVTRGIAVTGMANAVAGLLGVVGPVNYSLSPGVIMSTGCASRFTLLPAAGFVGVLAFVPAAAATVRQIPSVVIGCILLYVLTSQVTAGLSVAFGRLEDKGLPLDVGTTIGLPLLSGTIVAFLPPDTIQSFPTALQPVLGNGFVVGLVVALLLEHGLFAKSRLVNHR